MTSHTDLTERLEKAKVRMDIADLERGVRGPCDLIFGPPAALDADEGAAIALGMLAAGEMSVSYRRCKPLSDSEATLLRATEPSSGGTA